MMFYDRIRRFTRTQLMDTNLPSYLKTLHQAFLLVDDAPLECDGHTMMVSLALSRENIPHQRILGKVYGLDNGFALTPHCWIELDGHILDYRLRMWVRLQLGDEVAAQAPHGIFSDNSSRLRYQYQAIQPFPAKPMAPALLNVLTEGYSDRLHIPGSSSAL